MGYGWSTTMTMSMYDDDGNGGNGDNMVQRTGRVCGSAAKRSNDA